MTSPSPIHDLLAEYELEYNVPNEDSQRSGAATGEFHTQLLSEFISWGDSGCTVLGTTGIVELEYAAIQKNAGIFDAPCRGTIELTGDDRLDFVDRMTTQKLNDMKVDEVRLAFIISRKGTIVADVIVRNLSNRILMDLDLTAVQQVCDHFQSYIVLDDVVIENKTETTHWLWCLGPKATKITSEEETAYPLPVEFLGVQGVAIATVPEQASNTWKLIVEAGARPVGWYALNIARVEQSAAMFMIHFDTANLPHETSLIASRVRFDKGCYLGQEIVARIESLGQPKQCLKRLQMCTDDLPVAGSQVWGDASGTGTPVGVVTSSSISPMCGSVPVVIAMIGKKYASEHTSLFTYVGTNLIEGLVLPLAPIHQGTSE